MKSFSKQQAEIDHMKKFISSCGTYKNLVRQAKSRQKILDKMEADGLVEKVDNNRSMKFAFPSVGKLPPPVLSFDGVSFSYSGKSEDYLYRNMDLAVDSDSRVAIVGRNGIGKSTLLKLMSGELAPTEGRVSRHTHLKLGIYNQHTAETLDLEMSALQYMRNRYADMKQEEPWWRSQLGRFGLSGPTQVKPIGQLSDGLRARIVFAMLAVETPGVLLLDEPTNHLSLETIDALAEAINDYDGGMVLISHDFRLIEQVAEVIWVVDEKTRNIKVWHGDIRSYKAHLKSLMDL
jgi:ATP-binding cassette subfamily F protein 2